MTDIYERLADENEPAPATAPAAQLTGDQASNLMASLTVDPFHFSGHQMNTPGIPAHPSISTSGDKARLIPFTFNVRSGCPMAGHSAIRLP